MTPEKIEQGRKLLQRATPTPWETCTGPHGKGRVSQWTIRRHEFPGHPMEGDLCDEWGIYPPLGEAGPVALVSGEDNAKAIVFMLNNATALLAAAELGMAWEAEAKAGRELDEVQKHGEEVATLEVNVEVSGAELEQAWADWQAEHDAAINKVLAARSHTDQLTGRIGNAER